LVRAIVERESDWRVCAVSPKGAVGLMQLMPTTAQRLRVRDRCNIDQNVSGGVRYLAWLMQLFHNDLRLVAAYYAGEHVIGRRGLAYAIRTWSRMCRELERLIFAKWNPQPSLRKMP
jgi:soluble lytic murein transglycosylase-like protein